MTHSNDQNTVNNTVEKQPYPYTIIIFKGEGRILISPRLKHIGGYSTESQEYFICAYNDYKDIGNKVLQAFDFIRNSSLSRLTIPEREALNKARWDQEPRISKYKSFVTLHKHNINIFVEKHENGNYEFQADEKERIYPNEISPEEIGKIVMKMFKVKAAYIKECAQKSPIPETIVLNGTTHKAETPYFNKPQCPRYLVSFDIDTAFHRYIGIKSATHYVYSPDYDPTKDKGSLKDDMLPAVMILYDEKLERVVNSCIKKGSCKGVTDIVPMNGYFDFKAKMEYKGDLMYFYSVNLCAGELSHFLLTVIYPKSYENTENERKLMDLLDMAANTFSEKPIK